MKRRTALIFVFIILLSLFVLPLPQKSSAIIADRRAILWWQPYSWNPNVRYTSSNVSYASILDWAASVGFDALAVYGILNSSMVTYAHNLGLEIYEIGIAVRALTNFTAAMINIRNDAISLGYDGALFDDTQNVWGMAKDEGIDGLTQYQYMMNNITTYWLPAFGASKSFVDLAIFSDDANYTAMKQINSSATFSYYYPPDPTIRYIHSDITSNTTANAWNITDYYANYGLANYYKYQGWLWLEDYLSENITSTLTILKTYNAIVDFAASFNVDDLFVYNVYQLYNNHRINSILPTIVTAWKNGEKVNTTSLGDEPYTDFYWKEPFTNTPSNTSPLSYSGWEIINRIPDSYQYTTSSDKLITSFNGTNSNGYVGLSFERLLPSTELGLTAYASIMPNSSLSWKNFVLSGVHPHPNAWQIQFGYGDSRPLYILYRNSSDSDITLNLGQWTGNVTYFATFRVNETNTIIRIENSTWSYSFSLDYSNSSYKYNSIKMYSFSYSDITGNWASPKVFTSSTIDFINIQTFRTTTATITNMDAGDYVLAGDKFYEFQIPFVNYSAIDDLSIDYLAFTDKVHWINASYDQSTQEWSLDSGGGLETGATIYAFLDQGAITSNENLITITFGIKLTNNILDNDDVDIYIKVGFDDWQIVSYDYFNIYNLGGHTTLTTGGDAGRITSMGAFDIYAHNDSWVMVTTDYRFIQHVKIIPQFQYKSNDQGTGIRIMYFMDYYINGQWLPGWAVQLRGPYSILTDSDRYVDVAVAFWSGLSQYPEIDSTRATSWADVLTASPYNLYELRYPEEDVYSFSQKPATGSTVNETTVNYKTQWFIDLWFDQTNSSSYGAARVNAYQFAMHDSVSPWWRWLAGVNWGPSEEFQKEMSILAPLVDENSQTLYSSQIEMTRFGVFLEGGTEDGNYVQVTHGEEFDITLGSAPLKGIAKPTFEPTTIPIMQQGGGLFGTIWTALQGIFRSLSDIFGPAILNAWNVFVAFLDTVFGLFGWHNGFSQILSIITNFLAWVITSVGLLIQILITVFLFIVSVFTSMVTYFISFFQGLTTIYGMLVYIWDSVFPYWGWIPGVLYQLLPFLFLLAALWIISPFFEKRSFSAGMAGTRDRLELTVGWIWKGAMFLWRIIDFVLDTIYRLIEEVPVVE